MSIPFNNAKFLPADNSDVGIVLFHAYTGSTADMNFLARRLNRRGYNVLSPMLSGHGTRQVEDILAQNIDTWRKESKNAVRWMTERFDQVLVFGLSLGGLFAMDALVDESLPIQGGGSFNSPIVSEQRVTIDNVFKQYAEKMYDLNDREEAFSKDWDAINKQYQAQMGTMYGFKQSYRDQLTTISCPVLIVQALQDTMVNADDVHYAVRALSGVDVTLRTFPNNSHIITVDRERSDFEEAVEAFIKRIVQ